jgi:hypothetical protein
MRSGLKQITLSLLVVLVESPIMSNLEITFFMVLLEKAMRILIVWERSFTDSGYG